MDCYVYFKAEVRHRQQVILQVSRLISQIRQLHGITGMLQCRPQASQGLQTWMEVYRDVPEDFSAYLHSAVDATDLAGLIHGERHHEYFMDVSLCV